MIQGLLQLSKILVTLLAWVQLRIGGQIVAPMIEKRLGAIAHKFLTNRHLDLLIKKKKHKKRYIHLR